MKYTKLISAFLLLNLFLVFSMIFIANKTREIEKENNNINIKISKISEDLKINKIELLTHQNTSYLSNLYSLYFSEVVIDNVSNIISIKKLAKDKKDFKLVKSNK
tara:strand:- start:801 stop:1115 length:315 start_codon:yes stop_codon:yes gene_type:complete